MRKLKFVYRNYKNEIEERILFPEPNSPYSPTSGFMWTEPNQFPMHPDGGWMISGIDEARQARRTFELRRIIGPITEIE